MDEFLDKILDELKIGPQPVGEEDIPIAEPVERDPIHIVPEFYTIIDDFVNDIQTTFPEYIPIVQKWWKRDASESEKEEQCKFVFQHCLKTIPLKLFDILQKNVALFEGDDTEFLPNIFFKDLWNACISENTRNVIWKYLQAIMNAITKSMKLDGFEKIIFENLIQLKWWRN